MYKDWKFSVDSTYMNSVTLLSFCLDVRVSQPQPIGTSRSLLWGHPVHGRVFGSSPGLYLLGASSTLPTSRDNQKCL